MGCHMNLSRSIRLGCTGLVVLLLIVLGYRITLVNSEGLPYGIALHSVGDSVELNGAFAEYSTENTDGFSFSVNSAELMSINEYIDRYSKDNVMPNDPYDTTDPNEKTLAVLTITIRNDKNEGDERGYLDSLGWSLIPRNQKERWLRVDSTLFNLSVPQLGGAYQLSVRPGTEYTINVPFSTSVVDGFPAQAGLGHKPTLESGDYDFIATNLPVRHIVEVEL